ncbi:MAG: hypothetical protein JST54_12185 [Deltaproteobacteria bacterium]|nr:hypothetical protein [Deltaproteobacteria bacterium]
MRALLLILATFALMGCEAVLDYGDLTNGRPCDAKGACLAGYTCQNNVCVLGASSSLDMGDTCSDNATCSAGEECFLDVDGWPGGYCTLSCTGAACPSNSTCAAVSDPANPSTTIAACLANCSGNDNCRQPAYTCQNGLCMPATSSDVGDSCSSSTDCGPSELCAAGWPGGYCFADCPSGCPVGSHCFTHFTDGSSACLETCTAGSTCRNSANVCVDFDNDGVFECIPSCATTNTCT